MSIPTYSMSSFLIPNGICQDLDMAIRRFWWNGGHDKTRFLASRCWEAFCKPKSHGGLCFTLYIDFNKALLTKLGWKIITDDSAFWVKAIRAKYYSVESFWDVAYKSGDSYVWKGILHSRPILQKICFQVVGDGAVIDISSRPWAPWLESRAPRAAFNPEIPNLIAHPLDFQKVSELFLPSTRLWNTNLLARLFDPLSASTIKRITLLPFPEKDMVI